MTGSEPDSEPQRSRMSAVRSVLRPGLLLATLATVSVIALERDLLHVVLGLLGLIPGLFGTLIAVQAGQLLGAVLLGVRVHRVVLGAGARVREWRSPRRVVVLRRIPVALQVVIGPGRAPVRRRLWLTALVSVLVAGGLLAAVAVFVDGPFARGVVVAGVAVLVSSLVPRADAGSVSTGWLLWRMPRLPARRAAELEVAPLVDRALAEVNAGDLARAEATSAHLTEHHPDLRASHAVRITVLEARGRYADAVTGTLGMIGLPDQDERDMALALAGLAGLAAAAAEAGQVDTDAGLGAARRAATDAERLGFPAYKLAGIRALITLLDGDPDQAVRLAESAVAATDHTLSRADDLATLARAHMARGDNRTARQALVKAEELAPWWPRVVSTRARLDVG